jgi:hypothetical protein
MSDDIYLIGSMISLSSVGECIPTWSGRIYLKNDFRELANMESSKTDREIIDLKDVLFEIFHKLEVVEHKLEAIEDRLLQLEYAPETSEKYKEAKEHFESICPT